MTKEKRHFTLKEAQRFVPWLSGIFIKIAPLRERLGNLNDEKEALRIRMKVNGGQEAVKRASSVQEDLADTLGKINEQVEQIREKGIILRSINPGLVDFLSIRETKEFYLCWVEGESELRFWHDLDTGFSGRQLL